MKSPKLFLRTRIFLSMIFLVLISFLLTGIVTNYQIRESSDYYHGLRLERKEAQIQRALRSLLEERSQLEDNQLSFLFNQRPEQNISINTVLDSILTNEIIKISEIQNINFTLYDIDGSLIGSTVDTFLFFSISFYGTGVPWVTLSLGDLAVKIFIALLMLIPFRLLLGTLKPV